VRCAVLDIHVLSGGWALPSYAIHMVWVDDSIVAPSFIDRALHIGRDVRCSIFDGPCPTGTFSNPAG